MVVLVGFISRERVLSATIQLVGLTLGPKDLFEVAVPPHDIERLDELVCATDVGREKFGILWRLVRRIGRIVDRHCVVGALCLNELVEIDDTPPQLSGLPVAQFGQPLLFAGLRLQPLAGLVLLELTLLLKNDVVLEGREVGADLHLYFLLGHFFEFSVLVVHRQPLAVVDVAQLVVLAPVVLLLLPLALPVVRL